MWIFLYFGRIVDCGKKLVITEGLGINRMSGILLEAVALEGRNDRLKGYCDCGCKGIAGMDGEAMPADCGDAVLEEYICGT